MREFLKISFIILAGTFLSASPFLLRANPAMMQLAVQDGGGGGGQTTWIDVLSGSNDGWAVSGGMSQKLKYDVNRDIVSIELQTYSTGGTGTGHLEVWDSADTGTGTQIGGDSSIETFSGTAFDATSPVVFTFTSKPSITADVWFHVIVNTGSLGAGSNSSANHYEDTSYDRWTTTDQNDDLCFKIITE